MTIKIRGISYEKVSAITKRSNPLFVQNIFKYDINLNYRAKCTNNQNYDSPINFICNLKILIKIFFIFNSGCNTFHKSKLEILKIYLLLMYRYPKLSS